MKNSRFKHPEYQYLELLKDILKNGVDKPVFNNPGVTIRSVFGRQMRFDLSKGFPLLTTKKVFLRAIIHELLWFLKGDSNIKYLVDQDVHIWDEWAYKKYKTQNSKVKSQKLLTQEEFIQKLKELPKNHSFVKKYGDLGNVYGVQWRKWRTSDGRLIDQLGWAVNELKTTPFRKSIVVSAWNPEFIYEMALPGKSMALPPCHTLFQFIVNKGRLSLQLYQRSADSFLGVPFNIASYALFTMMIAQVVGLKPGEFVHTFGDVHIYSNHVPQVKEQLKRVPRSFPKMKINPKVKNIDDFKFEDFEVMGYNPYPPIKGEVTVVGGF
ncbi:MAG: thymidylate synthase [Microgenomates group bacterium Gr01-1014_7]|nr:MAG: thymidylate synthase [Microgenomates group bacterium Gr01-1014_7]